MGQINNLYTKNIKYKRLNLGYVGADSLLGHIEMVCIGSIYYQPIRQEEQTLT